MQLSKNDFVAAAGYLRSKARPLEAALFEYEFGEGSAEAAVQALAAFQNPDGGFGNGLEPDIRLGSSSVIATAIAFSHFRALGLPPDHQLVKTACAYLKAQYLADEKRWRIMPANIDDAAHAPWWTVGGDLWHSRVNPTAEILGLLYEYPDHFDAALREELASELTAFLDAHDNVMEMHDLLCYVALVENPAVPEQLKAKLMGKLRQVADKTVERSPEQWPNYTIPPLAIINTPGSPFIDLFSAELPQNFAFMLSWRGTDGAWHPNWQWGDSKTWNVVEREWSGILTLNNLRKLRSFGMIGDGERG